MKKISLLAIAVFALCSCAKQHDMINFEEAQEDLYQYDVQNPEKMLKTISAKAYMIGAIRATNKMLDATGTIYQQNPKPTLFIKDIEKVNPDLPDGFYLAQQATHDIIKESRTYDLVNSLDDARFYISPSMDMVINADAQTPTLIYKMVLFDKDGVKVNEWIETVTKTNNEENGWW